MNKYINANLQATDAENLDKVALYSVKDDVSGLNYLAVVPVGHVAYDELLDKFKVDARATSELIKTQTFNSFINGGMGIFVGENISLYTTTPITPIDYSKYDKKMILINNTHDADVIVDIYAFKSVEQFITNEGISKSVDKLNSDVITIPTNTTYALDNITLPKLANPYVAIALRFARTATPPTTGELNIQFYGR
jgi:hypothetical protein